MTEQEFAAEELREWEAALREQREAEYDLLVAWRSGDRQRLAHQLSVVGLLRQRADLLLAEAVRVMCAFREGHDPRVWLASTQMGLPEPAMLRAA